MIVVNGKPISLNGKFFEYKNDEPTSLTSFSGVIKIPTNGGSYGQGFNGLPQIWSNGGEGYASTADFGGKHCADVRSKTLRADITGSNVNFEIINWYRTSSDYNGTATYNLVLNNENKSWTYPDEILKKEIVAFGDNSPIYMTWSATYPSNETVSVSAKIDEASQTMFVYDGENNFSTPSQPIYNVNIQSSYGGSVSASAPSGHNGDLIRLSNTADPNYTFSGYNITGASLNQDNESFYIQNNDVNVKGKFISELGPEITEVWCYIDRTEHAASYPIQVYTLKLNGVGITPTEVKYLEYQTQTWIYDDSNVGKFNDEYNAYQPPNDSDSIRFKLPTIPSDNDEISYGPYSPWYAAPINCTVRLVGIDQNYNEYIIAYNGYNQQSYYNNNKQRVQLTYTAP